MRSKDIQDLLSTNVGAANIKLTVGKNMDCLVAIQPPQLFTSIVDTPSSRESWCGGIPGGSREFRNSVGLKTTWLGLVIVSTDLYSPG